MGEFNSHEEKVLENLLDLSHTLGRSDKSLAILGEGNTSARIDKDTFLIKASGSELSSLKRDEIVKVNFAPVLAMFGKNSGDEETHRALCAAKATPGESKPSVETTFHAFLLQQENVRFVGHTHPISINSILCSEKAALFAENRLFPDEIVCCGPASLLIDYVDPGTLLGEAIKDGWEAFVAQRGFPPKVILLKNHGVITTGASASAVLAATLMVEKAARIFAGTYAMGGPVFMPEKEVWRIHTRIDEHYRQKKLNLTSS